MSFPLPPPTRVALVPFPPGDTAQDMDQVIRALAGIGVPYAMGPSGDPTGLTDANVMQSLVSAIVTGPGSGRITLAPGQYYLAANVVTITTPGILIQGAGQWITLVNGVGTGTLIRMYSTQQYIPHSHDQAGGGVKRVTFDLNSMGAGSSAVHMGDIYNLAVDFGVRYNPAGSTKAAWFDNNYHWTEQLHGRIWCANNNGANVVFDHSADLSGVSTGSFDRLDLDIYLDQNGLGDGVVFQNGANVVDITHLGIWGNFTGGAAKHWVINLTGSDSSGYSLLGEGELLAGVELNTVTGTVPGTINFNSQANNVIRNCRGILDFGANLAFAGANNAQGSFEFDGPVYGDGFLQSSGPLGLRPFRYAGSGSAGVLGNSDAITTRFSALVEVTTGPSVNDIRLQGFNPDNWRTLTVMNNGTGSVTFAAPATSHVATGAGCVIAPNSDLSFTWNSDLSLWFADGNTPASPAPGLSLAPSGATAQVFERGLGQAYFSGLTSGTAYCSAIELPGGLAVNSLSLLVGSTAFTGVTHGWYALADAGRVVRAVSADQSGAWGTAFAAAPLSVSAAGYVTPAWGLFYAVFCATFTGSGSFPALVPNVGGLGGLAPILSGTSTTGLTTPPALGTTLAALTHVPAGRFYASTS